MSDNNQSSQMDDIMHILEVLERRISRLESSLDAHRKACDTMSDNVFSMYKRVTSLGIDNSHNRETLDKICHDIGSLKTYRATNQKNTAYFRDKIDDIETDIDLLYAMTHSCDNFCGNCTHCKQYLDGLYKCDITACEIDTDTSSCIRFESPKSDAEICKACSDKDTPRCYKCSHFPF